jgi:hypothetical protein
MFSFPVLTASRFGRLFNSFHISIHLCKKIFLGPVPGTMVCKADIVAMFINVDITQEDRKIHRVQGWEALYQILVGSGGQENLPGEMGS